MHDDFLRFVTRREGHFYLESGHHSALWLELDALFVDPGRIRPFVTRLAALLSVNNPDAVCGPLLGGAFLAQALAAEMRLEFFFTERVPSPDRQQMYQTRYVLPWVLRERARGKRFVIVDDVISAGSAVRGTLVDVEVHGGRTSGVGALVVLGSRGIPFFRERGVTIASVLQLPFDLWLPDECPLCAAGVPLETTGPPASGVANP